MRNARKKTITILIFLFLFGFTTHAAGASLVWNSSTGVVDGYKLYYGTNASNPSLSIDAGKATSYNIDKLNLSENVQYYFSVSAYNSVGESAPCPPVAYTPADATPPAPPVGLKAK